MLIITEKSSVAKSFAEALNAKASHGCYISGDTVITYCVGHLYELAKPESYNPDYKIWSFSNLPIIPETYFYDKKTETQTQTKTVTELIRKHKSDKIIIATDADREGEVIARIVIDEAGLRNTSNCFRFWVSEALTKDVVLKGLDKIKPWDEYETLSRQGFARQHADWLVGMNLSPYATLLASNGITFPVGRVQTAILAAIAQRNNEIKNFVPEPYYVLEAVLLDAESNQIKLLLINPDTQKTIFKSQNDYINSAHDFSEKNKTIKIKSEKKEKTMAPPELLSLTELQKIASAKYDYSPAETLKIVQKLYEEYKCMSYPRTPSSVLGDDDAELYLDVFNKLKGIYNFSSMCILKDIKKNKHIFNSKKLESHHALIPLDFLPESASEKEKNIYQIVLERFFLAAMPPSRYWETAILMENGNYLYRGTIKKIIDKGWKNAKSKEDNEEEELSDFNIDTGKLNKTTIVQKFTKPKKQFTDKTLLAFMEKPVSSEDDEKLVGLGTPATRAGIIQKLQDDNYVLKQKKEFFATEKGFYLLGLLAKNEIAKKIISISQTTDWEKRLESDPEKFENEIKEFITESVKIKPEIQGFSGKELGKCPLCNNAIKENKNAYYCCMEKENKCNFIIWKKISGANITAEDFTTLAEGKLTGLKKMKSKEGKNFCCKLKYNFEDSKVDFVFDNKKKNFKKKNYKG